MLGRFHLATVPRKRFDFQCRLRKVFGDPAMPVMKQIRRSVVWPSKMTIAAQGPRIRVKWPLFGGLSQCLRVGIIRRLVSPDYIH